LPRITFASIPTAHAQCTEQKSFDFEAKQFRQDEKSNSNNNQGEAAFSHVREKRAQRGTG